MCLGKPRKHFCGYKKYRDVDYHLPCLQICLVVLNLWPLKKRKNTRWKIFVLIIYLHNIFIILPLFQDSLSPLCCISTGYRLFTSLCSPSAALAPSSTSDTNFWMKSVAIKQHNHDHCVTVTLIGYPCSQLSRITDLFEPYSEGILMRKDIQIL